MENFQTSTQCPSVTFSLITVCRASATLIAGDVSHESNLYGRDTDFISIITIPIIADMMLQLLLLLTMMMMMQDEEEGKKQKQKKSSV